MYNLLFMIHQQSFITNQEKLLGEIINNILPKTQAVDILVGYFYYSGFQEICENLTDKKIRILVGLEVETKISGVVQEINKFDDEFSRSRGQIREDYYSSFTKLFNETNTFDNSKSLESFKLFYSKIKDGSLEIKKTEKPCHAKLYIFEYNDMVNEQGERPGTVITGSSNLSYSGLKGRIEINARFNSVHEYQDANVIFEQLWENSITIVDENNLEEFEDKVIEHIWYEKLYSPYKMFIRVLYEYYDTPNEENVLTPHDITNGKFYNLKYQTDAVQMALSAVENHNGVIVADVVGLGKSIIASAVARNLKKRALVICPPHLIPQWEEYRDEFGFTATVFSSGKIEAALAYYHNLVQDNEQYLIIVDEAHKYRNEYTQDYANLHQLCSGNKVMLLTATPFNNRPDDIYSMLKLFQVPTRSTLRTVDNLGFAFRELIAIYKKLTKDQKDGNISDEQAKEDAEEIAARIRSIISPLVIRRSRLDLEEIPEYKADLKRQNIQPLIPEDPILLEYDLGELKTLYLETLDMISPDEGGDANDFKAARYMPIFYVHESKRESLKNFIEKKTDFEYNLMIGAQTNMPKLMRRLLVRRFESSIASFKQSLIYMIESTENLLYWMEVRKGIPIYKKGYLPAVEDFYDISNDDEWVEIEDKLDSYREKGFFEIPLSYISASYKKDIQEDLNKLKAIKQNWFGENNIITHDPKLESFEKILREQLKKEPNRKIIVFTEFADTADYIADKLKETDLRIFKYTSSDASAKNKELIRSNFDAGYNELNQRNDYDILIATDAISEGYNLHRAGAIFNYDIPYNPTRVIQRIGRINRINKRVFDKLLVFNYFPTAVGEQDIRSKEISTLKMTMIHAIMGEDTKALTCEEELQSFFSARYRNELQITEQASWDNKYRNLLNQLKGTDIYKEALQIEHRSRTGRKNKKVKGEAVKGVVSFGKKGNDFIFKMMRPCDEKPITLNIEQAFTLFEADEEEQAFEVSKHFEKRYQEVKEGLFTSPSMQKNEKDRLDALSKTKVYYNLKLITFDYFKDLQHVIEADGLTGFDYRFINKLTEKDVDKLLQEINQKYLNRIIGTINNVDEGEETLILSEEFQ